MQVTLTKELEKLVADKVRSGRYTDESDVMRDALRVLEQRDDYESPALEAAILEGVRGPHRPFGKDTLEGIRKANATSAKLTWEETARAMAGSGEDWSAWECTSADGLEQIPWKRSAEKISAGRGKARRAR